MIDEKQSRALLKNTFDPLLSQITKVKTNEIPSRCSNCIGVSECMKNFRDLGYFRVSFNANGFAVREVECAILSISV
jgi:predicted HAD superfamily phosphohydrolase